MYTRPLLGRLLLGGALTLLFCGAPLRKIPAALDPSNPDAPEGAAPPLKISGEDKGRPPSSAQEEPNAKVPQEPPPHHHHVHPTTGSEPVPDRAPVQQPVQKKDEHDMHKHHHMGSAPGGVQ